MKRLATISLVILLTATLGPPRANALETNLTCSDAGDILAAGSAARAILQATVLGLLVGGADMIGDLLCFVGDRRCGCLRNTTESDNSRNTDLARRAGEINRGCRSANPNRQMSGIAQQAALDVCR